MEFMQVVFIAEMLIKRDAKLERQMMRASALHAWLTGYGPKKQWEDFVSSLGISEGEKFTPEDTKSAIEKSNRIIEKLDRLRGKKKDA